MVGSCPHVAVVVVLVWFLFPSLRYTRIYTLFNLSRDVFISVWNDWCMTSCCNGCGVCPHFPSLGYIYSAYLPHDVFIFQYLQRYVVYIIAVRIRAQYFPQLGRAETLENLPSEKGVNSKWKTKNKACPWLIWTRLSQRYSLFGAVCQLYTIKLWNTTLAT